MNNLLGLLTASFIRVGWPAIFLSLFIENVGIPFPTEFAYLAALALSAAKARPPIAILTLLTVAHTTGAATAYVLGRWGGQRNFGQSPHYRGMRDRLKEWFDQWGGLTVFVTRFIGYVRPWSSLVAGFVRFPFWSFLILTAVGSFLFSLITWYSSWLFLTLWQRYAGLQVFIVVGLFVVVTVWWLKRRR